MGDGEGSCPTIPGSRPAPTSATFGWATAARDSTGATTWNRRPPFLVVNADAPPSEASGGYEMFGLITLGIAGVVGVGGHVKSRSWVRRKLRYTETIRKPGIGLAAGVVTTLVAGPAVAILPFVGTGVAVAVALGAGAGVGSGVHLGAQDAKDGNVFDD